MKHVPLKLMVWIVLVCAFSGLATSASAEGTSSSGQASAASSGASSKTAAKTAAGAPSAADIAAAKASGKVWVNLNTGIYHRGGRWYGKTKDGKFMTADEAKKAGYKQAKRD